MSQPPFSPSRFPTSSVVAPLPLPTPETAELRAEQAAAQDPRARAVLFHELAVVEERMGDEMGAARDYLSAFNAYPLSREPLEGLLRLLSRRRSAKNLPKLLEALLRSSDTPEDKARALLKRAAFLLEYQEDEAGARQAFEEAAAADGEQVISWLELEILAVRTANHALRERAIEAQANRSSQATWEALLRLSRAELLAKEGRLDHAFSELERALLGGSDVRFRVLCVCERLARAHGRVEAEVQALEAQAELMLAQGRSSPEAKQGDVPGHLRGPAAAAEALLRAAALEKGRGLPSSAARLLDKALAELPQEPALLQARLQVAEALGDTQNAARLSDRLLALGPTGTAAASLLIRMAEASADREDTGGALRALGEALLSDGDSIPARALQIDLLANEGDAARLVDAWTSWASVLAVPSSRARAMVLVSFLRATALGDAAGAAAAIEQAEESGLSSGTAAHLTRLLASISQNGEWFARGTEKLLTSGETGDPAALLWELARVRWRDGGADAGAIFERLAGIEPFFGNILRAYGPSRGTTVDALTHLGREGNFPDRRAFALAAVRRADQHGDEGSARVGLRELLQDDPADRVVLLYLAGLLRRMSKASEAAAVLAQAASEPALGSEAGWLHREAGLIGWRSSDRKSALAQFAKAEEAGLPHADLLLQWTRRATSFVSEERLRVELQETGDLYPKDATTALQHFILAVFSGSSATREADSALARIDEESPASLYDAASLARLAWHLGQQDADGWSRALAHIEVAGTGGRKLALFERTRQAREQGDHSAALACTAEWANLDPGPVPAFEWLASAIGAEDPAAEARARRAVAAHLEGSARAAMLASASMVEVAAELSSPPRSADGAAASVLMNLELVPAGSDPRSRADVLSRSAEVWGDANVDCDARLLLGFNQLAAANFAESLATFEGVVAARPNDLMGWEGMRSAAEACRHFRKEALACTKLGELCYVDERGGQFWENAGILYLEKLSSADEAENCFARAFARDPRRDLAFDKLFRRVRERGEREGLLQLVLRRLDVAEEPAEIAKLFWEQARVLRQLGDREGALTALENVTMIEADHVGALALTGEIHITGGQFEQAAEALHRLARLEHAPAQQRLMSGIAAVDLYENKLGNVERALAVLVELNENGLATLAVRERLARAAAKSASYTDATSILEELMHERPTIEGRIEAARLALAIWRDRIGEPLRAERATLRLLEEAPDDREALELILQTPFDGGLKKQAVERGRAFLVEALQEDPTDVERMGMLADLASHRGDLDARLALLGALVALGVTEASLRRELAELMSRARRTPAGPVDPATLARIRAPADEGPLARLFAALGPALGEAFGPSLSALGVGRKQRIDGKTNGALQSEVLAWATAFGVHLDEIYVSTSAAQLCTAVSGDQSALVLANEVASPLSPRARQAVARELWMLGNGTTLFATHDDRWVSSVISAAQKTAEMPYDAMLDPGFVVGKQLTKALTRKIKRALPELCGDLAYSHEKMTRYARDARLSGYRGGALAAGDISVVLCDLLSAREDEILARIGHDSRARRLLAFVASPTFGELRHCLGLGVV